MHNGFWCYWASPILPWLTPAYRAVTRNGAVVARLVHNQEVSSSSLLCATINARDCVFHGIRFGCKWLLGRVAICLSTSILDRVKLRSLLLDERHDIIRRKRPCNLIIDMVTPSLDVHVELLLAWDIEINGNGDETQRHDDGGYSARVIEELFHTDTDLVSAAKVLLFPDINKFSCIFIHQMLSKWQHNVYVMTTFQNT